MVLSWNTVSVMCAMEKRVPNLHTVQQELTIAMQSIIRNLAYAFCMPHKNTGLWTRILMQFRLQAYYHHLNCSIPNGAVMNCKR